MFWTFYVVCTVIFVETEDETSDGDKDISGSKHSIFPIEHEANLFATSPGISPDCIVNSNRLEQELSTDGDKGMLQISWSVPICLRFQN